MKRKLLIALLSLLLVGCGRSDLENTTLSLLIGLDLDADGKLIVYTVSPVFSKEAKEKTETVRIEAHTIREARTKTDGVMTGLVTAKKAQTLLLGPRFVRKKDWVQLLDLMYRDPKLPTNITVALCEGNLKEIFKKRPPDKPRLPLFLRKLVDTAHQRNITVKTSTRELHRQIVEKGITPYASSLRQGKSMIVTGTALLDHNGLPADKLNLQQSQMLLMLQDQIQDELSLTIGEDHKGISLTVSKLKRKLKVGYEQGVFTFDVNLKLKAVLTENTLGISVSKDKAKIEKMIVDALTRDFQTLIDRLQKKHLDPVGFGISARAHRYQEWKRVEDHWPEAFAKAKVRVIPEVEIQSYGALR